MKKTTTLFSIVLLACTICSAQNLVLNHSFESFTSCPSDEAQIDSALFWMNPADPDSGGGTSDYFNQCATDPWLGVPSNAFGSQSAQDGVAYGGLFIGFTAIDYREYIEGTLASTLVAGTTYHFEMYVSLGDEVEYTSDDLGVYFSDSAVLGVQSWEHLPLIPQINNTTGDFDSSSTWRLVTGNYTAVGNEDYFIIGNFKDQPNTSYTLYNSSAVFTIRAYVYIDNVSLVVGAVGINEADEITSATVFPNPFSDQLNCTVKSNVPVEITIYDISSRKLLQQNFRNTVALNTADLAKGIYFYEIRSNGGLVKKGKLLKD